MLLLGLAEGAEAWEAADILSEKIKPIELLDLVIEEEEEDILAAMSSFLEPEISSCLKSDEEDDGARVPAVDPTG